MPNALLLTTVLVTLAPTSLEGDPHVTYEPAAGGFWVSGMKPPDDNTLPFYDAHSQIYIYSVSGRLTLPTENIAGIAIGYRLDGDARSLSSIRWLRQELDVSLPRFYTEPLYIGSYAIPGTPVSDLSARFTWASFARRLYIDQVIPIHVIPEPSSVGVLVVAISIAMGGRRRRR